MLGKRKADAVEPNPEPDADAPPGLAHACLHSLSMKLGLASHSPLAAHDAHAPVLSRSSHAALEFVEDGQPHANEHLACM